MTIANESTNFEKTKLILKALTGKHLSACAFEFCMYLLDQQYGYTADKGINGDSSGYGHIGLKLGYSRQAIIDTVQLLSDSHIIIKELNATRYGNRYKFNENIEQWFTSTVQHTSQVDNTSKVEATSKADLTTLVKPTLLLLVKPTLPNNKVSTVNDSTVNDSNIYSHWNSKNIIKHEKLTDTMKTKIRSALKDYSEDKIIEAINNYAIVLSNSSEYFFSYKWTLADFLRRGLPKFLNEAEPLNNFKINKIGNNGHEPKSPFSKNYKCVPGNEPAGAFDEYIERDKQERTTVGAISEDSSPEEIKKVTDGFKSNRDTYWDKITHPADDEEKKQKGRKGW